MFMWVAVFICGLMYLQDVMYVCMYLVERQRAKDVIGIACQCITPHTSVKKSVYASHRIQRYTG